MSKVAEALGRARDKLTSPSIFNRVTATAALASLSLLAAGCAGKYPGFDHSESIQSFDTFLAKLYKEGDVRKCIGNAALAYDGHVRSMPYLPSVQHFLGTPNPDNLIPAYTQEAETNAVTLVNPLSINIDSPGASPTWYIQMAPNGQEVFINDVALASENLDCSQIALPGQLPGSIKIG